MEATVLRLDPNEPLPPEFEAWNSQTTLALIFALSRPAPASCIARICAALKDATVLGCSTAGEIMGTEILDDTVVVALMKFREVTLRLASAPIETAAASRRAGDQIAQALLLPGLRAVIVLSDGIRVNGSQLVEGLSGALPPDVIVTGGLAGDRSRFEETWIVLNGTPVSGHVTAVGLYGPSLAIGHGFKGGWDIFGLERLVTASTDNILYELDGKPALALYKEYLGDLANELPASALLFPLLLRTAEGAVARTVLAVDETKGSMTFAGDLPKGSTVQFMRANFDRVIGGAGDAGLLAGRGLPEDEPVLLLAISCVGRRLALGDRCEEELEATLESMPAKTLQAGFYSYGEISPEGLGSCQLHNQTMTLTAISERR